MPRQTILAIDDDRPILELVCKTLESAGFDVITSPSPLAGLEIATSHSIDLIVLDVRMPEMNGLEVCRRLRAGPSTAPIPVIILTVDASESERVAGLEMGADDYMAKPFSPRELVARVRAVLRRASSRAVQAQTTIEVQGLSIDPARRQARFNGQPISLTAMEFDILHHLASRSGEIASREQIIAAVSNSDSAVLDRTIDVHVAALRRKLKEGGELIETIRGFGYRLGTMHGQHS